MTEKVYVSPMERGRIFKEKLQAESERMALLEELFKDDRNDLLRLGETKMGQKLLRTWEREIETYTLELETMTPEPIAIARTQAFLRLYRFWTRLLTQREPVDGGRDASN